MNFKEYLSYNELTGIFTWIKRPKHSHIRVGDAAGHKDDQGYIRIKLGNKQYQASRLAYFFINDYWPNFIVDHVNRVRDDNTWKNLEEKLQRENNYNRFDQAKFIGVTTTRKNRYQAAIGINGKRIALGTFDTPEEASAIYWERAINELAHEYKTKSNTNSPKFKWSGQEAELQTWSSTVQEETNS